MGLFDELFKDPHPDQRVYKPVTIQEAYMAIFFSILYADGEWSDKESKALQPILMRLRIFEDEDEIYYIRKMEEEYLMYDVQAIINGSLQLISQKFKPQLLCLCAELVLADGKVHHGEQEILEYLAKAANIHEDLAKRIIEVTRIRMMN